MPLQIFGKRKRRAVPAAPDPLDAYVSEFLTTRTANALEEAGIVTARDLAYATPERLLSIANFGTKTLDYVRAQFCKHVGLPAPRKSEKSE